MTDPIPNESAAKVTGYRQLSEQEMGMMNLAKSREQEFAVLLAQIQAMNPDDPSVGRWCALARTYIETGIMYACKAAARPVGGLGQR